ncbi:ATP-grasp domain-containing protein [Micromonospora sp. B11E3]|uniref:ATP-grasp domain-containing protein n=1 Tax=Micromonospora sp. B11E3 TaxID=3153562 RepID=UPI00325DA052
MGVVDHDVRVMLLVPADVLRPRRPDPHFAAEADAARESGVDVALVDHDALARPDGVQRAVARVTGGGEAVYRGWMLTSAQYAAFAGALARRGVVLRTSPQQYRRAHELPEWYPCLKRMTPASVWTTGTDRVAFDEVCALLGGGPAVLRDYTKSMKHYWDDAMFIPEVDDRAAAWAVAARFRELREDDFAGGFVLRRFERLTGAEVRTWWIDGACRLVGPHPDTPGDRPPPDMDVTGLAPLVAALRLPFVTVDLALRADGVWRVVEVGDGQVSDRPEAIAPQALVAALITGGQ